MMEPLSQKSNQIGFIRPFFQHSNSFFRPLSRPHSSLSSFCGFLLSVVVLCRDSPPLPLIFFHSPTTTLFSLLLSLFSPSAPPAVATVNLVSRARRTCRPQPLSLLSLENLAPRAPLRCEHQQRIGGVR